MKQQIELVKNTPQSVLGEGPMWHPLNNSLYWVDIVGMKLHCYNPLNKYTETLELPSMVGTVAPANGLYEVLVALENGIFGLDKQGQLVKLADYPADELPNNRFNDGKIDPKGRLWVGTMNKEVVDKAGNLYLLEGGKWQIKQAEVTISNGLAWSVNKQTMFYIDTSQYQIWAYDYDCDRGVIDNKKVVVEIPEELGAPDGMTIDQQGMLWVAHWGGSAVIRWNPDTGERMETIELPVPHVTSCTFGGEALDTLYITTAQEGLNDTELKKFPLSGCLFRVKMDVQGLPANIWR